jgi:hypothetical protein
VGNAAKKVLDYVTRRFNASSAGLESRLGSLTFAEAPLSAISRFNWSPESTKARPLFEAPRQDDSSFRADLEKSTIKNRKNHVMTKSTPTLTLTQSGLLAVLLQRQRYAVIELARRHAHRKHMRAAFWSTLAWPFRALTARTFIDDSAEPFVRTVERHP